MVRKPKSESVSDEEFLEVFKGVINRSSSDHRNRSYFIALLVMLLGLGLFFAFKKQKNPIIEGPSNSDLYESLPDAAKKDFVRKYGHPDEDDTDCELYYLIAVTTRPRPCYKCPIWCLNPAKTQILVSTNEIYYIGKTCRQGDERKKEHQEISKALDLRYEWVLRGSEAYITKQEKLHLKSYFSRHEAEKEGCTLFLPPGNTIGMSQADWKKLLKELK